MAKGKQVRVKLMKEEVEGLTSYKLEIDNEPVAGTWIDITESQYHNLMLILDREYHKPQIKREAVAKQTIWY